MPPLPTLPSLTEALPLGAQGLALAVGILLIGWGARLYVVALLAPGVVGGLWLGVQIGGIMGLATLPILGLSGALAIVGGLLCHFAEQVALRGLGAGVGAAAAWLLWPLFEPPGAPWWGLMAGSAVGVAVILFVYRRLLPLLTASLGGLCVAWAVDQPSSLPIVAACGMIGALLQAWLTHRASQPAPPPRTKKPKKT